MKNLFKIFILVVVSSFALPACTSDDDFSDIVESSQLDTQANNEKGDGDTEVVKPSGD